MGQPDANISPRVGAANEEPSIRGVYIIQRCQKMGVTLGDRRSVGRPGAVDMVER